MKIFQLTPLNLEESKEEWLSSEIKEVIIVRAESEERARRIAASVTMIASETTSNNQNTPLSPWYSDQLSSCCLYSGNEYKNNGTEEILSPLGLRIR